MNRSDFQKLAGVRIEEAKVLLDNARYDGSYYLAGYAVECALKACIAKQTKRYDFPPQKKVIDAVYTHDLKQLINSAGLSVQFTAALGSDNVLEANWKAVTDWSEARRYELGLRNRRRAKCTRL